VDGIRVLLVDDEADYRATLGKRLGKRHLVVEGAGSAEEALALLQRITVDVVILDVRMPGLSGIEALREIKARYGDVEVIMLTGHASVDVAVEGVAAGAFDYLMKPVDLDELLYKVQDAFQQKTLREAGRRQHPARPPPDDLFS
jgi:DNA-binding NtrC family response regulator